MGGGIGWMHWGMRWGFAREGQWGKWGGSNMANFSKNRHPPDIKF